MPKQDTFEHTLRDYLSRNTRLSAGTSIVTQRGVLRYIDKGCIETIARRVSLLYPARRALKNRFSTFENEADNATNIWTSLYTIQDSIGEGIVAEIGNKVLCPR